jgi:hypothetical protein
VIWDEVFVVGGLSLLGETLDDLDYFEDWDFVRAQVHIEMTDLRHEAKTVVSWYPRLGEVVEKSKIPDDAAKEVPRHHTAAWDAGQELADFQLILEMVNIALDSLPLRNNPRHGLYFDLLSGFAVDLNDPRWHSNVD